MFKNMITKETVLITGASSGIGLEIARQFALHAHPVILTAPVESELFQIAEEFNRKYGVSVRIIAADLSAMTTPMELFDKLKEQDVQVDILVNDAGFGYHGDFASIPLMKDIMMMRVNVEAVVSMTKLFLAPMIERGYGRILNVASVAGFVPGPQLAVYHATKAFVLSFSEAIATELEDSGVTVTALCPGAVDTDFFMKADMIDTNAFQNSSMMAPQEVAKVAYEAVMEGERVVIPGGINKVMALARNFVPESLQAKMNEVMYAETNIRDRKRNPGDIERKEKAKMES
jgi:hypothetical protein